ncbi:hypothetical protein N7G274_008960 [Stereocaulon virgatum]|uniref:Uncharacterized protein n=1 Tax=Stereocaulon virgatum TaxID=373712 RepID=A0ABR3ZZZ1_9LECA
MVCLVSFSFACSTSASIQQLSATSVQFAQKIDLSLSLSDGKSIALFIIETRACLYLSSIASLDREPHLSSNCSTPLHQSTFHPPHLCIPAPRHPCLPQPLPHHAFFQLLQLRRLEPIQCIHPKHLALQGQLRSRAHHYPS